MCVSIVYVCIYGLLHKICIQKKSERLLYCIIIPLESFFFFPYENPTKMHG